MADQNTEVFKAELEADASNFQSVIKTLNEVSKSAADSAKGLKLLQNIDLSKLKVNLDTGQIKKDTAEVEKSLKGIQKIQLGPVEGPETLGKFQKSLPELSRQFQAVGSTAEITNRTVGTMFRDFQDGIALIRGGGNAFVGAQQAMFGLGQSSETVSKIFRFFGKELDEIGQANERLAQAGVRASAQMSQLSSVLVAQTKIIKDVAKAEFGMDKTQFNAIDQQIQRVEKSYKDMQTTIESGGKPTAQQLARIKVETANLEQAFTELKVQGIIPANSETDKLIQELISGASKGKTATEVLVQQYKAMADAADKAQQKQAKGGQESEKQVSLLRRLIPSFSLFSRGANDSANSLNHVASSSSKASTAIGNIEGPIQKATGLFSNFASIVSGTFLGNALFNTFGRISGSLAFMQADFVDSNRAVQDFRITMSNMMKGTGLDVEATQAQIESFVSDVVAKTPFELTDAFESFQKLIVAGFDPKQWLVPVADAAAAVNKPMEQLIGAMAKIQVGAKGAGIDMLRDFGIPVNQVGSFVDSATGRILAQDEVMNDQRNLYKMTAEDLAKLGISFNKLEFDKQGSLVNSSADALNILNGYLQQNATFAGAAEGRSRSLGGVISNLKDFVINLSIAVGQPIFEKLTMAGQLLLDKLNFLQPTLSLLASTLGTNIGAALDQAIGWFQNFSFSLESMPIGLQNMVAMVSSLMQGDWATAWGYFLTVVDSALFGLGDLLNSMVSSAFDWGYSLGGQLADGIMDAASSILTDALNFIGDTIASFLMPGSPPKEGPLKTIDKWGKPLSEMFSDDLAKGLDPKPVEDAIKPLAGVITGQKGPLADQLNKESAIEKKMREIQELRAKLLKAQELGLPSAQAITEQLKKAEGELQGLTQAGAQAGAAMAGAGVPTAKGPTIPGAKSKGGGGAGPKAGKEPAAKETLEEKFAREKNVLEERKRLGIISQEDYLKEMLRLEQNFVKDSLESGLPSGLDDHANAIKNIQTELDSLKPPKVEKGKGSGDEGEGFVIPTAGDILSGFGQEATTTMGEIGTEIATEFTTKLKDTTVTKFSDFRAKVMEKITEIKDDAIKAMTDWGVTADKVGIGGAILGLIGLFGLFSGTLLGLSTPIIALIGLIGLVTVAIVKWDVISQGLNSTYEFLSGIVTDFTRAMGGQEESQKTFIKLMEDSDSVAGQFGQTFQKSLGQVFSGDFSEAMDTFTRAFTEIDTSSLTAGMSKIGLAIGTTIWSFLPQAFTQAVGKLTTAIGPSLDQLTMAFSGFFEEGRLGKELFDMLTALGNLFVTIWPNIQAVLQGVGTMLGLVLAVAIDVVASLVSAFVDALPFIEGALSGIVRVFTGMIESITSGVQLFRSIWLFITGDTTAAKEMLMQAFTTLGSAVGNIFGGLLQTIINVGTGILGFLTSFLLNMISLPLMLIPGFQNAGAAILGFKDYFLDLLTTLTSDGLDILNGLIQNVKDLFLGLYNYLVGDSIIPDLVNGIITWISQLKTRGIQFFTDFIDNAIDLFEIEKFTSMGKNAILGILEGLKSAESMVINYLKQLIEEKIVGGIEGLLGIQSPSLVFAELGVDTMLGFLKGVQDMSKPLADGTQLSAKEAMEGFIKGIGDTTITKKANSVFRSIFFKLGRAFDIHKEVLDEHARKGAFDWGDRLAKNFNEFGNELSTDEREKMKDILADITNVSTETLAKNVYDELGVTLDQFVDKYFLDFKAKRDEFARENLGMVQTLLDDANKIIEAFNDKLLEQRQKMYIDLDIATALTGQDLTPEKLKEMVDAINSGKSFGADIDSAILAAFNAQEKYNASLEEQKKIQEAQLKLEQQRSRLAFLQQQLQLVQQAKDAGIAGDLLEGLNLGADAATSDVLEQMAKITELIIKNTQEQLGIKSPSKIFYGFGENLMKGLGDGIKRSFGLVTSNMDKVNNLLTKVPQNPQVSRLATNVPSPIQNSRNITYAPTNNIGDKLDAALLLRQQQDAFMGALR